MDRTARLFFDWKTGKDGKRKKRGEDELLCASNGPKMISGYFLHTARNSMYPRFPRGSS